MLGLAMRSEPVFMKTVATSCAGMSVCIERMTAMSSTNSPVLANRLLTSVPLWPIFWNLKGEPMATPPLASVLPSILVRKGFGSHVSMCDGAPWAKMWMTALALPGKWGRCGASALPETGAAGAPPKSSPGRSMVARLSAPRPMPIRLRNCRRVRK